MWQDVPIINSNETIVRVPTSDRLLVQPAYFQQRIKEAMNEIWLREDIVVRLQRASLLLPPGVQLVVLDGWRSVALQTRLYQQYYQLIADHTGLEGEALQEAVQAFVSLPSEDPDCPSPHLTGGSVDCTLAQDGELLDMGTVFDDISERAFTQFFEQATDEQEYTFRNRRRLLCAVMTHVGFSNYSREWWHYDHGNQFHHDRVGGVARYGLAQLPPSAHERRY